MAVFNDIDNTVYSIVSPILSIQHRSTSQILLPLIDFSRANNQTVPFYDIKLQLNFLANYNLPLYNIESSGS